MTSAYWRNPFLGTYAKIELSASSFCVGGCLCYFIRITIYSYIFWYQDPRFIHNVSHGDFLCRCPLRTFVSSRLLVTRGTSDLGFSVNVLPLDETLHTAIYETHNLLILTSMSSSRWISSCDNLNNWNYRKEKLHTWNMCDTIHF